MKDFEISRVSIFICDIPKIKTRFDREMETLTLKFLNTDKYPYRERVHHFNSVSEMSTRNVRAIYDYS